MILLQKANKIQSKGREEEALNQEEFVAFYYSLLKRPEIDEVFLKYAKMDDAKMSAEEMAKFMKEEQKEEMLEEECLQLIKAFEPKPNQVSKNKMRK